MSAPKVLITNAVPFDVTKPVEGLADIIMGPSERQLMPRTEVLNHAPQLSAVINQAELKVDEELLDAAPHLRIIANISIGINNLDLSLLRERGVVATNTPGFFSYPVAEHVIGGILCIMRRLLEGDHFVRQGQWTEFEPGRWDGMTLKEKTLGIIGYGSIGQNLHRMAECMGMQVICYDPVKTSPSGWTELDSLLATADVVSLHVPQMPSTEAMVDAAFIAKMKTGAILVNAARGKIMQEAEVIKALQKGKLGGAILDVFEFEPNVSREFFNMRNVLLTPHVAGGTRESRREARLMAFRNVAAVLKDEAPLTPVT